MEEGILLAAINRDQLNEALKKSGNNPLVAFATLDDKVLSRLKKSIEEKGQVDVPVYFYEQG